MKKLAVPAKPASPARAVKTGTGKTAKKPAARRVSIVNLGAVATRRASQQALADGISITVVEGNRVVKIAPGGARKFLMEVAPSVEVQQKTMKLK